MIATVDLHKDFPSVVPHQQARPLLGFDLPDTDEKAITELMARGVAADTAADLVRRHEAQRCRDAAQWSEIVAAKAGLIVTCLDRGAKFGCPRAWARVAEAERVRLDEHFQEQRKKASLSAAYENELAKLAEVNPRSRKWKEALKQARMQWIMEGATPRAVERLDKGEINPMAHQRLRVLIYKLLFQRDALDAVSSR